MDDLLTEYEDTQRKNLHKEYINLLQSGVHRTSIYILEVHYEFENSEAFLYPYEWDFKILDRKLGYIPLTTYHAIDVTDDDSFGVYIRPGQLCKNHILKCQHDAEVNGNKHDEQIAPVEKKTLQVEENDDDDGGEYEEYEQEEEEERDDQDDDDGVIARFFSDANYSTCIIC